MGTIQHDVVVAVLYDDDKVLQQIRDWIEVTTFGGFHPYGTPKDYSLDIRRLFTFIPSVTNAYTTVIMGPDGSNEGWDASNYCNQIRKQFIQFLDGKAEIIHVSFGELGKRLIDHV